MTKVLFRTYGHPTYIIGGSQREVEFEGSTVKDLLDALVGTFGGSMRSILYPHGATLSEMVYVLVNGTNISHLERLDTQLKDGDVVALLPITAGG